MNARTKIMLYTAVPALVLLLVYNLFHTGALLTTYAEHWAIGYAAALGIEIIVVSLSLQISTLRRSQQGPGFFIAVLVAVVTVSALANIATGHKIRYGGELTMQNVKDIDALQAIIGLTATGLFCRWSSLPWRRSSANTSAPDRLRQGPPKLARFPWEPCFLSPYYRLGVQTKPLRIEPSGI